jgi:signal peptide peptidase SppA
MPTKTLGAGGAFLSRLLPRRFRPIRPVVPVLRLAGPIGMSLPGAGSLTLAGLAGQIESAFSVEDAKAVALIVRSPGGGAAQSHMIFKRIRACAAEKGVRVFAFIEDVGASGGYMLACAADEIFADPASIVGSIGVVSAGFGLEGLIAKIGVERRVHTAGESKAMLDPFLPERADDVARLKALQQDIHADFIALVKERRGPRLKGEDADLFNGAFWSGRGALELGLIDGLSDIRTVMRERFGDEVELRLVPPPRRGLLFRFLPAAASQEAPSMSLVSTGELLATIEARALWARYGL